MRHCTLLLAAACLCVPAVQADPDVFRNPIGMTFVEIPAGSFIMGTEEPDEPASERPDGNRDAVRDESPAHRVEFPAAFYLGTTEVTQGQWLEIMGTQPGPQEYWAGADWRHLPVVSVSWHDAGRFIQHLQARDPTAQYRLPTEAQWEYAARAGTRGLRPVSPQQLPEHAWYIANSGDVPHPVGTRRANPWGLYDMLGNAWEWTRDWYAPDHYAQSASVNPQGPDSGRKRVRRGGSYHCPLHLVRPGYRAADRPDTTYSVTGFRLIAIPAAHLSR
jgi:formylglycine-generating enzyme required for sulfatase activity